jgi:hypothetical protein
MDRAGRGGRRAPWRRRHHAGSRGVPRRPRGDQRVTETTGTALLVSYRSEHASFATRDCRVGRSAAAPPMSSCAAASPLMQGRGS